MNELRFASRLGFGTLRSRPALTVLAILLIAIGTAAVGGLVGTVYLLRNLQQEFVSALTVEIELTNDAESARGIVMSRAERWPSAEFVQYVAPDVTLREMQQETGEDLLSVFGANPFPPLVRVRFGNANLRTLDSLSTAAKSWPEVADVVFPRRLWTDLEHSIARFQGGIGLGALAFALVVIFLVGLCLRAQVRNRASTWDFLVLSGISRRALSLAFLTQQSMVGLVGGILACALLSGLTTFYGWLFLHPTAFPVWFYLCVILSSILLSILSGLMSPRKFSSR
jgi:cell division transport system permease protein